MKKIILIIGSNSFSGSHFVNLLLKKNFKVIGISRSKEPLKCYLPYEDNKKISNLLTDLHLDYLFKNLSILLSNSNI